jgi:sterol desaturase/sphingolipid hydroxylase (fatty acid hydroxylase superfamily)
MNPVVAEGADRSGRPKVPKPTGAIAIASVIAGIVAVLYSAMLGFGVNETCDTRATSSSECNRLNWMALFHLGTQIVLVIAAGLGGVSVWRAISGWRRGALMAAVALVYVCLVATAVVVYTDAAWDWANSRS